MQTAKCKCGEKQSWGDLPPCSICEKCGTAPGYANAETVQSHRFSKKFDQNTGKPFNFCMVCGRKEEVLFEPKCSGCGHSEHKFLCLHTTELSNGEHDVCDCQSFSPAEPDATERANILSSPVTADVTVNAILKRKLEIAMRGLDEYGDEDRWDDLDGKYRYCRIFRGEAAHGYELAQRIKAEIEEVK